MFTINRLTLPQDVLPNKKADKVSLLQHSILISSEQTKVIFTQNVFAFIIKGEKSVHYYERHLKINNQQFLLFAAGNFLMRDKVLALKNGFEAIALFFDSQMLDEFFIKHGNLRKGNGFLSGRSPVEIFERDNFLNNFIGSLTSILESTPMLVKEVVRLKFEELMIYLCHSYPEKISAISSYFDRPATDVTLSAVVEAHVYSNLTIEELAFLSNMSISTFKRRFFRIYNTSPNKWMLTRKMNLAAEQLKKNGCKANDIYLDYGYENLSSFIQSFKEVHGITPKQYQLRNLKNSGIEIA